MKLRFTIRDLCWLTLVVAMGSAWWAAQRSHVHELKERHLWERRAEEIAAKIEADGGEVIWWTVEPGEGSGLRVIMPLANALEMPFDPYTSPYSEKPVCADKVILADRAAALPSIRIHPAID